MGVSGSKREHQAIPSGKTKEGRRRAADRGCPVYLLLEKSKFNLKVFSTLLSYIKAVDRAYSAIIMSGKSRNEYGVGHVY